MANLVPTPIQSSIPLDLEKRIRELHVEYSSHTGPPGDLDDNRKRWLVVGICVHSILSPALRKYVDPVVTNLYNSLKITDQIDLQTQTIHLRKYGAANIYLNYEAINQNKATHGYRSFLYDYKVQNAVDLSKLFLQTHMAHYTAIDCSCDSSALFGMIDKIDKFPGNVQIAARNVRADVRNPWAHCNFTEWDTMKYNSSLQQIENFIYLLKLNAAEESQFIAELNKWKTNGINYLEDTTLGLELVNDIRQQIQSIMEVEKVICKSADREFSTVHTKLKEIGKTLNKHDKRISSLENTVITQGKTLMEYGSSYDADISEIERWTMVVESNLDDHTLEKTICIRKNNFSKETSLGEGRNLYEILKLDFKEILKLDRNDQDTAIKNAFHREIRRWHPDTARELGDHEMVHKVIASYEILRDCKRRAEYHKNIEKGCDFEDWAKSLGIGFIAGAITNAVGAEITNGVSVIVSNAGLASGGGAVFSLAATTVSEPLIQLQCVSETKARFTFLSNKWFTKMIVKFKEKGDVHVKKTTENGTAIEVPMNAKDVKVYFQVMRFFKMWCDVKKWNRFENKWYDEPHKFRYKTPPEQRDFTLGGSLFYEGVINVTDERHDDVTDM